MWILCFVDSYEMPNLIFFQVKKKKNKKKKNNK